MTIVRLMDSSPLLITYWLIVTPRTAEALISRVTGKVGTSTM